MRDGNRVLKHKVKSKEEVVSLPMRDGNEWNEHIQRSGQKLLAYL